MREKNRNNLQETEKAFALSIFLLNILILFILAGVVWMMRAAISASSEFGIFMRGGFLS